MPPIPPNVIVGGIQILRFSQDFVVMLALLDKAFKGEMYMVMMANDSGMINGNRIQRGYDNIQQGALFT